MATSLYMSSDNELRVLLLGKTGAGKSSLGNTLLGRDAFLVECGFSSVTFRCQWSFGLCHNVLLKVTDTPGVSDTDRPEDEVLKEIGKSVAVASPGPHIVLMVIRCGRFTSEEHQAYITLKKMFGENITKFLILVFTGQDQLPGDTSVARKQSLEEILKGAPETLQEIILDADGRYFAVSNVAPRPERDAYAVQLTIMMQELVSKNMENGQSYFTNDLCGYVQTHVDAMVERRVQKSHMTPEGAGIQTRKAIVRDEEEPGFFTQLGGAIKQNIVPILDSFAGTVVSTATKAAITALAASRCSIM